MTLYLYNTLSRTKEAFVPLNPDHVGMYVCGPTVYDLAHIGNARPVIVFDVLYRLLKRRFKRVTYVRNITDVDDKINAAAKAEGVAIDVITARTAKAYHDDMAALGALPPDEEPRATQTIAEMIAMIETLIAKGHAYAAEGHVLFHVPSFAEYGRLSRHNQDELIAGARVEVAPFKRDPRDFVLWKPSDADLPGWDSPWGRGRPGWHIECSAMSKKYLGVTFDIHGGGRDLVFPHHENELAQSVCANAAPFVRYWVHNGFLTVEDEKMSKSLGNFRTVREELEKAPGEALRLAMLKTHYRQPLDWTDHGIAEAKADLDRFYGALKAMRSFEVLDPNDPANTGQVWSVQIVPPLDDDLNTPRAIAGLHTMARQAHRLIPRLEADIERLTESGQKVLRRADIEAVIASNEALGKPLMELLIRKNMMLHGGALLGILQNDPLHWFQGAMATITPIVRGVVSPVVTSSIDINAQIEARNAAKKARNFAEADRIRDELKAAGIVLEDRPGGKTEWRRA
ncbi:cysteine--tRNA ligase [Desertibaculum subflavum]|uniref:cysteine--tRNA ligase n=1 Tax=Desertibaculum subflavum TaxID=2268458 RepID=UPI000E6720FC